MKNWMKYIWKPTSKRFNKDAMNQYDPKDKNAFQREVEEAMADDPFLSDAIDGMQEGGKAHFDNFSENFLMDARFRTKAKFPWTKLAMGSVFLGLTFYFLHWIQENSHYPEHQNETKDFMEEVVILNDAQENTEELPQEEAYIEQIHLPEKEKTSPSTPNQEFPEQSKVVDTVKIVMRPIQTQLHPTTTEAIPKVRSYWWVDHYKLKKYHYTLDGGQINPVLSGTGANNQPLEIDAEKDRLEVWNYTDYWKRTFKALKKEQYKAVEFYCSNLLNKYEKDENAIFYRAMALYHQKKYKQAYWDFKVLMKEESVVFYEEAQFYGALSLKYQGKKEAAIVILHDIAKAQGFYAEQARKELEK